MHIFRYKEGGKEKPDRTSLTDVMPPVPINEHRNRENWNTNHNAYKWSLYLGCCWSHVRLCQTMLRCEYFLFWLHHSTGATNTGKRDQADLRCPDIVEVVIYTLMYNCTCTHSTWLMLCLLGGPDLPPYVDFRDPPTHWLAQSQNITISMTST